MSYQIMEIPHDAQGIFISRPNRFLGIVELNNNKGSKPVIEKVHIHDPGRLRELLFTGNHVLLRRATNPQRKTRWDLVATRDPEDSHWVLIHSGLHRTIVENLLEQPKLSPFGKLLEIKPEVTVGSSRLDFQLTPKSGTQIFVEVKGCTLAIDGKALFPDAPTTRGTRHVHELLELKSKGYDAALLILVFRRDAECFAPNSDTDPAFADAFCLAFKNGIDVHIVVLEYDGSTVKYMRKIPVCPEFL
jgi:sugar fermentation stimulation protein A